MFETEKTITFTIDGVTCQSPEAVEVTYCEGACPSRDQSVLDIVFNGATMELNAKDCKCCTALEFRPALTVRFDDHTVTSYHFYYAYYCCMHVQVVNPFHHELCLKCCKQPTSFDTTLRKA